MNQHWKQRFPDLLHPGRCKRRASPIRRFAYEDDDKFPRWDRFDSPRSTQGSYRACAAGEPGGAARRPGGVADAAAPDRGGARHVRTASKAQEFRIAGNIKLMVRAAPWFNQVWVPTVAERVAFSPPERLFVFCPAGVFAAPDAQLICTIPWRGGDVLLRFRRPDVLIRSGRDDPWRVHFTLIPDAKAAQRILLLGRDHAPYSVEVPYPLDNAVVNVIKSLGIKEVSVGMGSGKDDQVDDPMDLTPLAGLPLESLILRLDPDGKFSVKGLAGIRGLESLGIDSFKSETLRLAFAKDCPSIKYLNVFANHVDCDFDPRRLSELKYCRIRAGQAVGMTRFVERTTATRLDLNVLFGLAELTPHTRLSPAVKYLLIEDSFDLKDVSFVKASPNVQQLRIVGCSFIGHADEFVRKGETGTKR